MAKARRPIFVPVLSGFPFVRKIEIEFDWYAGFALAQTQKSISALHKEAARQGFSPILEISSKSMQPDGVNLSAFNLYFDVKGGYRMSVECAFQGSKVFEKGGPFNDLYMATSREAKMDERLRNSGNVISFRFLGEDFPTKPVTAFYDWLYISALYQSRALSETVLKFKAFSDIAFNPKRSINCQAHSAALFVALQHRGIVRRAIEDRDFYLALITNKRPPSMSDSAATEQLKLL